MIFEILKFCPVVRIRKFSVTPPLSGVIHKICDASEVGGLSGYHPMCKEQWKTYHAGKRDFKRFQDIIKVLGHFERF